MRASGGGQNSHSLLRPTDLFAPGRGWSKALPASSCAVGLGSAWPPQRVFATSCCGRLCVRPLALSSICEKTVGPYLGTLRLSGQIFVQDLRRFRVSHGLLCSGLRMAMSVGIRLSIFHEGRTIQSPAAGQPRIRPVHLADCLWSGACHLGSLKYMSPHDSRVFRVEAGREGQRSCWRIREPGSNKATPGRTGTVGGI